MQSLLQYSEQLKKTVNSIDDTTFENQFTIELDCSMLPKMGNEGDCRYNLITKSFFEPLLSINQPALYWFTITSNHTAKEIYEQLINVKKAIERNLPAYKKGFNKWDSKVLYVGKVKNNILGRMIVHLGYYINPHTQGLQLCHWTQELKLQLNLNYIILPNELTELAPLFEKTLANNLLPIFGKHK